MCPVPLINRDSNCMPGCRTSACGVSSREVIRLMKLGVIRWIVKRTLEEANSAASLAHHSSVARAASSCILLSIFITPVPGPRGSSLKGHEQLRAGPHMALYAVEQDMLGEWMRDSAWAECRSMALQGAS